MRKFSLELFLKTYKPTHTCSWFKLIWLWIDELVCLASKAWKIGEVNLTWIWLFQTLKEIYQWNGFGTKAVKTVGDKAGMFDNPRPVAGGHTGINKHEPCFSQDHFVRCFRGPVLLGSMWSGYICSDSMLITESLDAEEF